LIVVQASGKKTAAMMKKKGIGLFATKTLSADLAAICGKNKMPRTEVTKAIWGCPQARGTTMMDAPMQGSDGAFAGFSSTPLAYRTGTPQTLLVQLGSTDCSRPES